MKKSVIGGVTAAAVVVGGTMFATRVLSPSLPDVQVPAVQLSSAEGIDDTVQVLDLLAQTSGANAESVSGTAPDSGIGGGPGVPAESPLVLIHPQNSTEEFDRILDGEVGTANSQLNQVISPNGSHDAVTYLILENGS